MTGIDALQGATASLCLLAGLHFLLAGWRHPVARYGALFALAVAVHALLEVGLIAEALGPVAGLLAYVTCIKMVFFWWFALALFDDDFILRHVHVLPAPLLLALAHLYGRGVPEAMHGYHIITFGLMAHVATLALRDLGSDLVDARRRFRVAVSIAIPLFVLVLIADYTLRVLRGEDLAVHMSEALLMTVYSFVFALWLTRIERGLVIRNNQANTQTVEPTTPADALDLARITRLAEQGALLEAGLTIGKFAERLHMPEHRLRRLINQCLGYRNFADFLNAYRVAEAERRLADPERSREQIITHAFALGYNSLTPFNRAFKARTGVSPTEFRQRALREVLEEVKLQRTSG
ncbi:helix-turn-helix domain-containing protein [Algicella marina]|nr:AraC family transcriptional regulator [Algicella marina]